MTDIAKYLEHTLLKLDTTQKEVQTLCQVALEHEMGGICIPPLFVRDARRLLGERNNTKLVTVVGFPMGYSAIAAKSEEIRRAIDEGADEIDAVINIAAVKGAQWNHVEHDIDGLHRATNMRGKVLKVIAECSLLTELELKRILEIAHTVGVPFISTSTGVFGHPTTVEMIKHLHKWLPEGMKIKASGGIRTRAQAEALIAAGADRIGASNSLAIIKE